MKIRSIFLMIGLTTRSLSLHVDLADDQLAKFLDRYSCSQDIEEAVAQQEGNPDNFGQDRKFFLKGVQVDRMVNALRLKRFIADHKLDRMGVAEKCWSKKFQEVVSVAVTKVTSEKEMSTTDLQQLNQVAEGSCFCDWHAGNILCDRQGKHIFIDTEDVSFDNGDVRSCIGTLWNYCIRHVDRHDIQDKLRQWLENKYEQISKMTYVNGISLKYSSKYDDYDIDFNQVKFAMNKLKYQNSILWEKERDAKIESVAHEILRNKAARDSEVQELKRCFGGDWI